MDTGSRGPEGKPGPASAVIDWTFYPSVGDTILSGEDVSAKPLQYNVDSLQVYYNGVQLSRRDDYTTTDDGTSIVLKEPVANANDLVVILSQVAPDDYDPINTETRLQIQIDDNKEGISGLDVRVTATESDILGLQGLADNFTTEDVKVAEGSKIRARGDDLETQKDINQLFNAEILTVESSGRH